MLHTSPCGLLGHPQLTPNFSTSHLHRRKTWGTRKEEKNKKDRNRRRRSRLRWKGENRGEDLGRKRGDRAWLLGTRLVVKFNVRYETAG